MLRFSTLAQRPRHFQSFTGLTVQEFQALLTTIEGDWQDTRRRDGKRRNRQRKPGGGRKLALPDLADRVLVFVVYAKLYPSYLLLEHLVGVDESTICRLIQELAPLLSERFVIHRRPGKKLTTLAELKEVIPDLDEVLVDATEQKIPRPEKKRTRKKYHSGKKQAFTLKTQIVTDLQGSILHVADPIPGRRHDYAYFRETNVPHWLSQRPAITAYGDRGYQGVNTDYPDANMRIPIKRSRKKRTLTRSERIRNTKLTKKRIVVEHTFAQLKKFRMLADVYRNAKERYSDLFKAVACLVNLRMACRATA